MRKPKTLTRKPRSNATPAQKAANRRNAQRSTGPKSEEGKAKSALNALTHGLRAQAPIIPGEDPAALDARCRDWTATLAPRNDLERYHVKDAANASWRIDRTRSAEDAALARRARHAADLDDLRRESDHAALLAEFPKDPRRITPQLRRTSLGCAFLLEQLQTLIEALDARGYWEPTERDHALRLLGASHDDLYGDPLVYDLTLAHLALSAATPDHLARLRHLIRLPIPPGMDDGESRRRGERLASAATEAAADPAHPRRLLRNLLAGESARLAAAEPALLARDALDRAEAPLRAAIDVTPEGLLRARYETLHRNAFRHALRDLRHLQSLPNPDPNPTPTDPQPTTPTPPRPRTSAPIKPRLSAPTRPDPTPNPPAPTPRKPPAPNEPNLDATPTPATPPAAPCDPPSARFRDGTDPLPLPPDPQIPLYYRMTAPQLRACADEIERLALHEDGLTPTPSNLRSFADDVAEAALFWTEADYRQYPLPSCTSEPIERPLPRDMSDPRAVRAPYHLPPEQLDFIFAPGFQNPHSPQTPNDPPPPR